jgi:protein-S-isoprenylcysteine O-methyltransferase Ste14
LRQAASQLRFSRLQRDENPTAIAWSNRSRYVPNGAGFYARQAALEGGATAHRAFQAQPPAHTRAVEGFRADMYIFKLISGIALNVILFAVPLFLPAGTLDWWRGWVIVGAAFVGTVGAVMSLSGNRALLEERLRPPVQKGQPRADKILLLLLFASFFGLMVFTSLDVFRFRLLCKPGILVSSVGLGLFIAGWWIAYRGLRENAFAAPVVRHQEERNQTVIDTGVYSVVRHPMYAGGALLIIGLPLWLESYAGALLASVPIATLALRIVFEERFLGQELKGYGAYAQKVRYKLIPFVW